MSDEPSLPPSPYKGLVPFDDSDRDARFFFGRERESELVSANLMASRLTILYGPSGVGKSSLLQAGVTHRLRAMTAVGADSAPGLDVAFVDSWRDDPVAAVAAAVGVDPPDEPLRLADALAERTVAVGGELYLMLDQIEEYFLYHRAADGGVLAQELEEVLTRPDLRVHVLIGIRDDALADLDAFKARLPGLFGNVLRLDHLDRDGARSAIVGPLHEHARLGGATVTAEPALVEAVIEQVSAGRIEQGLTGRVGADVDVTQGRVEAPYLQLVLERLWAVERSQASSLLRKSTLDDLGGAAHVVEQHLDLALAGFGAGERDLTSALFNHLVTPSGTKIAHGVGDLARYAGTTEGQLDPVLHALSAQRILRPLSGSNGHGQRYEIFHDVLADGILAWRSQHESSRTLERERADARRRHRRLAILAGGALAALALMTGVAAYAIVQGDRADERAQSAKARELTVASFAQLGEDPGRSLLLAREAAKREQTPDVENALRTALVQARGLRTVDRGTPLLAAASRGSQIATVADDTQTAAAAFSGDARYLARASGRQAFVTTADGRRVHTVELPDTVVRVAIDPSRVAAASADGTVVVDAYLSGRELVRQRLPGKPTVLALSPDGSRLVVGSGKIVRVVDIASRETLGTVATRSTVLAGDVSPDGSLLATASADGAVRLWSIPTLRLADVLRGHENLVRAVAFTPDGERLVTGSADRTARVWRVKDGRPLSVLAGHSDEVRSVHVSLDGGSVVTASPDGTARVWDATGDPELRVIARFDGTPTLLDVDGGVVATRLGAQDVDVDRGSGRVLRRRPASAGATNVGDWRAQIDGPVVRLSRPGRELVLVGHSDDVTSVRVSPDGSRILTASLDHDVREWSAENGMPLAVVKAHQGRVSDARYSPDGRWIVTAGPGAAGVWDARTRRRLFYLGGHDGPLSGAAFAPDSRTIVTTGADGTVRTYRCEVCGDLDALVAQADRRLATYRSRAHRRRATDLPRGLNRLAGALLELVRLRGEGGEARREQVVGRGGRERPRQQPSEAGREDLRRRQARGSPGADAARTGHELADRLGHAALHRFLALAGVRVSAHERLAQEARHLVPRQRARRLEARGRQHCEVERRLGLRIAAEDALGQACRCKEPDERAHDGGVGAVGWRLVHAGGVSMSRDPYSSPVWRARTCVTPRD